MSDFPNSRCATFINRTRIVVGLAVVFLATQYVTAENIVDDNVKFETTSCWNEVDSKAVTECGWLIVPEDWNNPKAQKLKLPVVIYRPVNPDPSLSPVIFLGGGPGGHPLGDNGNHMHGWRREADFSFPGRILIVFDQRGTGLSSPKLDCREAEEPIVWWPISKNPDDEVNSSARVHAAFAACMARHLAAGRKLQVFNTLQSATDVEALRRALELGDIVLYGVSYGTRLALTVMKFHPEHIEAAILDSVFPPQAEYAKSDARTFGPVLDRLFEACNQDKDCAAAYPDLRSRLLRVLEQLAREPAIVEIVNLEGGEPLYAQVDHRMFLSVLRGEMYHTARLPNLPVLISGVAQGEYWRLKQHVENSVYGDFPSSVTMGARLAVVCNDDPDAVDRQPEAGDAEPYPYLKDFVEWGREYPLCGFWTTNPETRNRDAVVSDVPSLLLAGGLDASTTVEQAEMAAETLPVSHLFVFPANAHVQLRINPCAWEVVDEFLANPAVRPRPDCLASLRRPAFLTYGGN